MGDFTQMCNIVVVVATHLSKTDFCARDYFTIEFGLFIRTIEKCKRRKQRWGRGGKSPEVLLNGV